jgi:hypothetical protein
MIILVANNLIIQRCKDPGLVGGADIAILGVFSDIMNSGKTHGSRLFFTFIGLLEVLDLILPHRRLGKTGFA